MELIVIGLLFVVVPVATGLLRYRLEKAVDAKAALDKYGRAEPRTEAVDRAALADGLRRFNNRQNEIPPR